TTAVSARMLNTSQAGTLTVQFRGERGGTFPMNRGQRDINRVWAKYPYGSVFSAPVSVPIPNGASLTDVGDVAAWALARYEALRTMYLTEEPTQVVHRQGTLPLQIIDLAGQTYDSSARMPQLTDAAERSIELPTRCAVLVDAGVPRWLVLQVSRRAIDMASGWIL